MVQKWSTAGRSIQNPTWRYGGGLPLALVACLFISHNDIVAQSAPTVPAEQQGDGIRRFSEVQKTEQSSRQIGSLVTLSIQDSTIGYVIRAIGKQMNVPIVFNNADPRFTKRINIRLTDESAMDAFAAALQGTGLIATVAKDGRTIVVGDRSRPGKERDSVATGQVIGVVVDSATGKPVSGAIVEMPQFKKRVLTSEKGTFVIPGVATGSAIVAVRFIGYRSTSRSVTVVGDQTATLRIVLVQSASMLSGVVTTATGVQRKVEVGNDVTVINVAEVIQKNPVSTVTDLLATRVPGLVVGRASGEPGAKTEIRIRGTGSIRASNAPILVVDGVQVISDRTGTDTTGFATSPIDQLDINSISTIEVLKGPSAVAMYGSNAANGVIVVTTKRGEEGPMRWNMAMGVSQETLPGAWPQNYFAWGENLTAGVAAGGNGQCLRYGASAFALNWGTFPTCRYDSTTVYQILNDPGTTVLGKGFGKTLSGGVSGGVRQFRYSMTGSYASTLGVLKLPDADVDLLAKAGVSLKSWQRRPQALETYNGTLNLGFALGAQSELQTTSRITRQDKRTTPLINALGASSSMNPPVQLYDRDGALLGVGSGILVEVPDFLAIQNWIELKFTNSATFSTTIWDALKFETTAGLDVTNGRETYLLQPGDYCPVSGAVNVVFGTCTQRIKGAYNEYKSYRTAAVATDLFVRASAPARGYKWLNITPRVGLNVTGITNGQSGIGAEGLPMGGLGVRGAETVRVLADAQSARRTVGMYAEAGLMVADRLFLPFSVRTDVGNAIGSESKPIFPRVGFSYIASDEPGFRNIPIIGILPELRIRTAFGVSGRQPGLADKYRTFAFTRFPVENVDVSVANLYSVGNSKLSPEIVREWELGFDVTAIDHPHNRWSAKATLARKNTSDLLEVETLPLSLGTVRSRIANIGDAMNQSVEVSLEGFHRAGWLDWNSINGISTERGKLVRMNGVASTSLPSNSRGRQVSRKNVAGYPLNGLWTRPVVGYIDGNGNGLLEFDEVIYSDTEHYLGSPAPRFTATSIQQLTVAAQLTLTATVSYENGAVANTYNSNIGQYSRVMNDPTLSLEEQARLLFDGVAQAYRVSTLRLQTMQLTYVVPPRITARYLRMRSLQVAVSGTNLGIWSTFAGQDPSIGGILRSQESPILPTPRTYGITLRIQ